MNSQSITSDAAVETANWANEAVRLCSELIQIDTQLGTSDERVAAEYVAAFLADLGIESELVEPEPRRATRRHPPSCEGRRPEY